MPDFRSHWTLDPAVTFLNHGSFGACPRVVLERQRELREQMEREPVRFFVREAPAMLADVRAALGEFAGADPEGLALVRNATEGANAVLRSLPLDPGDELLVTDHEYNACRNILDFVAARAGAVVRVVEIPFPIRDADLARQAIVRAATDRTRLALIDHISSQTALIFPIERIVRDLEARGIDVLVDGAHAPATVDLDLDRLGAAYYTGNAHKWLCAPKGAAFLYVRADRRERVRPAIISHGANAPDDGRPRFRHEFDWLGTDDPTPWLCIPQAIEFMSGLVQGGLDELRRRQHEILLRGRDLLLDALGIDAPAPDAMLGFMASLPLPDRDSAAPAGAWDIDPVQETLFRDHAIEVPVMPWPSPPRRLLRISAAPYNDLADYEKLARALRVVIAEQTAARAAHSP